MIQRYVKLKFVLLIILGNVLISSCFNERRLIKNFDHHNNTRLVKINLFENNTFRQEIEITTLVSKKNKKSKRKYYDDPKRRNKKLLRDTFINIGIWEKSKDTILLHGIVEFNNDIETDLKIFDIEISEFYDSTILETKFEIIEDNQNEFKLIRISVNNLNPYRSNFPKSNYNVTYSDSVRQFKPRRYGRVKQEFKEYFPKFAKSNHFIIRVTEILDHNSWTHLETIWTKHLLVSGGEVIPGRYRNDMRHGYHKRKIFLIDFDKSQRIRISN